ncbi:MAG: nitroreductase family protein [Litorilinea sp.]
MNVYDAIRTMLAVREYEDKPIPDAVVTQILEAGRYTGSSRNTQQWDFVVVRQRETLAELGRLATTGRFIGDAALAVAVVVPDAPVGFMDGARATQDMMLAAWGAGVGSNWVGNTNTMPIRTLLRIPEDRMLLNITAFGYPARSIGAGKKQRRDLAQVAHAEMFGTPFAG